MANVIDWITGLSKKKLDTIQSVDPSGKVTFMPLPQPINPNVRWVDVGAREVSGYFRELAVDIPIPGRKAYLDLANQRIMLEWFELETKQMNRYMIDLSKARHSSEDLAKHEHEIRALAEATYRTLLSMKGSTSTSRMDVERAHDLLLEYIDQIGRFKKKQAIAKRKKLILKKKYGKEVADLLEQAEAAEKKVLKLLKT